MFKRGKRSVILFWVMAVLPLSVSAQDLSVEDLYLQQSAEIQVVRDLSADTGRDMKVIALDYIGEIIERGDADDEIRKVLADLTLDGVRNPVRLNGRVINNFPDLRIRAVNFLARMGTPEANSSLINILELATQVSAMEEDPSVITAAIRGVAQIGRNDDNGESSRAVNAVYWRYNTLKPDNALAMAVISAIESFVDKGVRDEGSLSVLMSIQANHEYIKRVREKAASVLIKMRAM
jgi:HEAT repeat protein